MFPEDKKRLKRLCRDVRLNIVSERTLLFPHKTKDVEGSGFTNCVTTKDTWFVVTQIFTRVLLCLDTRVDEDRVDHRDTLHLLRVLL